MSCPKSVLFLKQHLQSYWADF